MKAPSHKKGKSIHTYINKLENFDRTIPTKLPHQIFKNPLSYIKKLPPYKTGDEVVKVLTEFVSKLL